MATASQSKEDTEEDIKNLHFEMIHKLSGEISPENEKIWNEFKNMMKATVSDATLAASKSIFDICDEVLRRGRISFGKYEVLSEVFRAIEHQPCQDIILKYTRLIKEKQNLQSPQGTTSDSPDKYHVMAHVEIDGMKSRKTSTEVHELLLDICKKELTKLKESNLPTGEVIQTMSGLRTETTEFMAMVEKLEKKEISTHDVVQKCLIFTFEVRSRQGLENLWITYNSAELLQILQEGLISEQLLKRFNAEYIKLKVYISEEEYQKCLNNIELLPFAYVTCPDFDEKYHKDQATKKGDNQCRLHQLKFTLSCRDCSDVLICAECKSTSHSGHQIVPMSKRAVEKKNRVQEYLKKADNMERDIKERLKSIDDKIKQSSDNFKNIENQIIIQAEMMKADIDRIAREFVDKNSALQHENLESLSKCKHDIQIVFDQLKETMDSFRSILASTNEIMILETDINFEKDLSLPYVPNMKIGHFGAGLGIEDGFGTFDIEVDQEMETLQEATSRVSSVLSHYPHSAFITSVEKSTSGGIWMISCNDNNIYLVNHQGKILHMIILDRVVQDISVSTVTGNLWLCFNNAVYEVSGKKITKRFTTDSFLWRLCMTLDNNVVVSNYEKLTVYSTAGQVLHNSGQRVIVEPIHITACTSIGDIAVCDLDGADFGGEDKPYVCVFNSKLELKHKYFGRPLLQEFNSISDFYPVDAVYDSRGRLLIADGNKNCVQLVNSEGRFLRVVHTDVLVPTALTLIKDGLLCFCFGETSKIISYKV